MAMERLLNSLLFARLESTSGNIRLSELRDSLKKRSFLKRGEPLCTPLFSSQLMIRFSELGIMPFTGDTGVDGSQSSTKSAFA